MHTWSARRVGAMLAAASILIPAACGDDDDSDENSAVSIKTFSFDPSTLTVEAGTTVTWTNEDAILHTATSGAPGAPDGKFDGPMDGAGKSFAFTFDEAGSYKYFCMRHDTSMFGEVVVN